MITVIRPGYRARQYRDGTVVSPRNGAQPDPNGNVVVQYDEVGGQAFHEEVFSHGTTFDYEEPPPPVHTTPLAAAQHPMQNTQGQQAQPANNEQGGGNGHVTVPVTTTGALENVPGTRKEESRGKIIAVLVALLLATLVGIMVYFMMARGSNTPPPVVTVVAPPPSSLPKCSDKIAECEAFAAMLGENNAACAGIDTGCTK